jgi:DNA polymerase
MISLDFETYCDIDIRKVGLDAYTAHPSFEVMMMAYRLDDGPLLHWQAHLGPFPEEARERLLDPGQEKWAYNSAFERRALLCGLGIQTPVEGWRCSMALAYMRGFTGSLGAVGEQMLIPVDQQKQKTGAKLIRRFCMPQRITRNQPYRRRDWNTDPDDWDLFTEYNRADVFAEEAVRDRLLPYPIPDDEWELYALDQRVNDRGMPFDRAFAINVSRMSEYRRDELLDRMRVLTGLKNPNSQAELLRWLKSQGYPFEDIRENTVKRALTLNLPQVCAEVLGLRQWSGKTATKKAATALLSAGQDDRIRHMFQFVGASRTGRWAGRGVQPQNLQRTPKFLDPEKSSERLDTVTDLIRDGNYEVFPLLVEEPMAVFGGTMRGMFRASPGHMLHICDYSSIEAVGLAWASRCERMLEVFHRGRDIYRDFGMSLYKKAYEAITSAERQICKSACLGCGYGLGPGRVLEDGNMTGLLAYAANMGVALSPEEAVVAVRAYRDTYAEVVSFWWACGDAAQAVLEEHRAVTVGALRFEYKKPFLLIRLPSGRCIYYYKPRMEMREIRTGKQRWDQGKMRMVDEVYVRNVLTVMGRNQRSTQWERIVARPSHLVENIVQALTRDILKVGLQRLDREGFQIVGHSHDEIIVESREESGKIWEMMRDLMVEPIPWLPGFPLSAAGWSGKYYRK